MQSASPNPNTGITAHTTPAIQHGHRANGRGTPHTDGRVNTTEPALHSPCHPTSSCHPTIRDSHPLYHDEGGVTEGYPTTRTLQRHTHHPHTTHPAMDNARHDSSTLTVCTGIGGTRAARTGQCWLAAAHTHRHSTHRGETDTIHSSTLTLFTFT